MRTDTNRQWTTYRILDATIDNPDLADPLNVGATALNEGKGFILWGDTSAAKIEWDEANDRLLTTGADIQLGDDDYLQFGDGAGGDVSARWVSATSILEILPLTDNVGAIHIGNGTKDIDLKIFLGATTQTVEFDVSAGVVRFGSDDNGVDVVFYGDTADALVLWDETNDLLEVRGNASVRLNDDCYLKIGTDSDITMRWTSNQLKVAQATADSRILWGVDGAGINHVFYGDTPGSNMSWDQSVDSLVFNGANLSLEDDDYLKFGDEDDIAIRWTANSLKVTQATANSRILWGIDGEGIDQVWYGDTAGASMIWDQSANQLLLEGADIKLNDDDYLRFGDAVNGDMTMRWQSSGGGLFSIVPTVDNTIIQIGDATYNCDLWIWGADSDHMIIWDCEANTYGTWYFGVSAGYGVDVNFYGQTAGQSMVWDASAGTLDIVNGAVTSGDQVLYISATNTAGAGEGLAISAEAVFEGQSTGACYGAKFWTFAYGTHAYDVRALDIGIYSTGATMTGAYACPLALYTEFSSSNPPTDHYMMRFNTNAGGDTPDAWFHSGNKEAIAYVEETTHSTPNKVGAIKVRITGSTADPGYLYVYSDTGA